MAKIVLKAKAKPASKSKPAKSRAKRLKIPLPIGGEADARHEAWLKRNWAALEPTLVEARAEIARGEGITFNSIEEAAAHFIVEGRRRRARRK